MTSVYTPRNAADPTAITSDGTYIWVTNTSDNTVTQLSASDGAYVNTYNAGLNPDGLIVVGSHVLVADNFGTINEL